MSVLGRLSEPMFIPKETGMPCPHCKLRSIVPVGDRVYVCINPDCKGDPKGGPGSHVVMLSIDPMAGPQLLPWEDVAARDRLRKTDPRGFLQKIGALR